MFCKALIVLGVLVSTAPTSHARAAYLPAKNKPQDGEVILQCNVIRRSGKDFCARFRVYLLRNTPIVPVPETVANKGRAVKIVLTGLPIYDKQPNAEDIEDAAPDSYQVKLLTVFGADTSVRNSDFEQTCSADQLNDCFAGAVDEFWKRVHVRVHLHDFPDD